jgi:FkbM family methyltransferase
MTRPLDVKPASAKALARYIYARVPGAARVRFALKDMSSRYLSKPEYSGVTQLSLGGGEIIDIGANRGQSVAAFRRLAPGRRIVAFEPDPRCSGPLRRYARGPHGVTFHDCALGREPSELAFFIPRYGRWECDGLATTSRDDATNWLSDPGCMFRFDERLLRIEQYRVECRTLDSFALSPTLIKLHAQCAEFDILNGAIETLRRSQPALMCAFVHSEIVEFLRGFGYQPYRYIREEFVSGVSPYDVTFTWFLTEAHLSGATNASARAGHSTNFPG